MSPVRCEACDAMLDEGAMLHGLCTPCKHAVAMCLDIDDDDLAFTTDLDNVEVISLEDVLAAEDEGSVTNEHDDQSECV